MQQTYRPGPLGSLIDVYERTLANFISHLLTVSESDYVRIARPNTSDADCRSIQTMMRHVILAGYGYANYVRTEWGIETWRPEIKDVSKREAVQHLEHMFAHTLATFDGRWNMTEEEVCATKVQTRWGPVLDLEVLMEHAICHLLRHARMMEMYQVEGRELSTRSTQA